MSLPGCCLTCTRDTSRTWELAGHACVPHWLSEVRYLGCRLLHNLRTEGLEHMDVHQLQQLYSGVSFSLQGCRSAHEVEVLPDW